jgi:diguanylate cyclase (GGDEF)-like protein
VNTHYGYPEGDRVLCETARALETCLRDEDLVARLGGDEFIVLAPHTDELGMRALAERVLHCTRGMEERLGLQAVPLTASVGWVMYPKDADEIDQLIAAADVCIRSAKATGKDRAISGLDPQLAVVGST